MNGNWNGPRVPAHMVESPEPESAVQDGALTLMTEVYDFDDLGKVHIGHPPKENQLNTKLPEICIVFTPKDGVAGADQFFSQCTIDADLQEIASWDVGQVSDGHGGFRPDYKWKHYEDDEYDLRRVAVEPYNNYGDPATWVCVLRPGVLPEGVYRWVITVHHAPGGVDLDPEDSLFADFHSYGFCVGGRPDTITDEWLENTSVPTVRSESD
ncbi:hypothetical protein GE09DRAFT_1048374 [Coniochaeta sp. 2T2.1]|nr:hypothetical protein GE09DRAFT_1048374 [Coniochaeta sp. 2T2.1]